MAETSDYYEIGDIVVIPFPEGGAGLVVISEVSKNNLHPILSLYEAIYYDVGADCSDATSFLGNAVIEKRGSIFDIIPNAKVKL